MVDDWQVEKFETFRSEERERYTLSIYVFYESKISRDVHLPVLSLNHLNRSKSDEHI